MEKQRTPEMDICVKKSKAMFKIYNKTRSEDDHELFLQAERERYKQHYKEHTEEENKRTAEWRKEQNKIIVKCKICNVEMKKLNRKYHLKSIKHSKNVKNEETYYNINDVFEYV